LIDGHNLIAHLPGIDLADPHDEAKLVLLLRSFCARTRKKMVVIFDHGLPGGKSNFSTPSVEVIFATAQKTTADRIIMERIRDTRDVKGWAVVSSDEEVLHAAVQAGMKGVRCHRFAQVLMLPPPEDNHPGIREHLILTEGEVQEWMEFFGVDEEAEEPASSNEKPRIVRRDQPEPPPEEPTTSQMQTSADTSAPKKAPSANDVDAWMQAFGDAEERKPTDPRQRIQPRHKPKRKTHKSTDGLPEVDAESGEADDVPLTRNTVDAWMKFFGGEPSKDREPTDLSPQRKEARKQGRYRNADGKREPTVHKRMSTSEDIYLNSGEVDAWMDVFGVQEEDDEDES
ncbi:MAG: NYN domain-containing protein, partial [Anaerolineae bacterium]|nr:NYN domain-containing protein [Anaerolineae bacterium]